MAPRGFAGKVFFSAQNSHEQILDFLRPTIYRAGKKVRRERKDVCVCVRVREEERES